MTLALNRRWLRYSLRTLFIVMTVFGCWLAYEMNWIRQRHEFLAKQQTLRSTWPQSFLTKLESVPWWKAQDRSDQLAPGMLWLFGEQALAKLIYIVPTDDITIRNGKPEIAGSHPEVVRAMQLFPEANRTPVCCHGDTWSNPKKTSIRLDFVGISD